MTFADKLKERARETKSIVCMGLDPMLEKIPLEQKNTEKKIIKFYVEILNAIVSEDVYPAIVKPNIAFYEQYGFDGFRALEAVIALYQAKNIPVLLDAKRGDIGKTSAAYAKALFEFWNADAVTIAPYMGSDSVKPFIDYCKAGRGVYILVRTSNPGAADIQNLDVKGTPLYMKTAHRVIEWSEGDCVGAVVGATSMKELTDISEFFVDSRREVPLLIPGVGAQGGSAHDVVKVLKETKNPLLLHRINSSAGINYAYERYGSDDYAGSAVKAIKELNEEINLKI